MPTLTFFDMKNRESFTTDEFTLKKIKTKRGMRKQAIAIAPSGIKAFRFVSMDFKK